MSGWRRDSYLRYCSVTPKILLFGVVLLVLAGLIKVVELLTLRITKQLRLDIVIDFSNIIVLILLLSVFVFLLTILERIFRSNKRNIMYILRKRLCAVCYGNPLRLKEGEIEPIVIVSRTNKGYKIRVDSISSSFDDVSNLGMEISGCLRKRYGNYAVVAKEEDIAGRYVDYFIEDVVSNFYKQSVYSSLSDVPTHLTRSRLRRKRIRHQSSRNRKR